MTTESLMYITDRPPTVMTRDITGDIVAAAFDAGLLLNAPFPDTVRFMPALNVTTDEIDRMIEILGDVLQGFEWTKGIET